MIYDLCISVYSCFCLALQTYIFVCMIVFSLDFIEPPGINVGVCVCVCVCACVCACVCLCMCVNLAVI